MKGLAVLFFWVFVAFLVWVIVAKKKGGPMKIQLIVCIAAFALFALCTGLSGGKGALTKPEPTTAAPAILQSSPQGIRWILRSLPENTVHTVRIWC